MLSRQGGGYARLEAGAQELGLVGQLGIEGTGSYGACPLVSANYYFTDSSEVSPHYQGRYPTQPTFPRKADSFRPWEPLASIVVPGHHTQRCQRTENPRPARLTHPGIQHRQQPTPLSASPRPETPNPTPGNHQKPSDRPQHHPKQAENPPNQPKTRKPDYQRPKSPTNLK